MSTMLVTGANGFVGRVLCTEAHASGMLVRAAARVSCDLGAGIENVAVGQIDGQTDWSIALRGVDVVVHLAARVHVMRDKTKDPLTEFRTVNVAGTERLARCAAEAGVKRLVYVSSIKVNGEATDANQCFSEEDVPMPREPYALTKWEAEQALHKVAQETGLEVVIIRPPLVYGEGVKGNFALMMKAISLGIPLPLASVQNQRDLIYVKNLVDGLIACALSPTASGKTYLISDGEPISTPDLLTLLAQGMGVPLRIFSCSPAVLFFAAKLFGKSAQLHRLFGSLRIDSTRIRVELGWEPRYSLFQGLQETTERYRK